MTSFNLEVVRDAFLGSVPFTQRSTSADADSSHSEDEFEDALSDVESSGNEPQAGAVSPPVIPTTAPPRPADDDFVDAIEYSKAFNEIAQFFKFLNIAFAFVAKNLESSCEFITLVANLHEQEAPVSLEQTLEYDEQVDNKYGIVSCVLWLHRPLEFIIMLFRELAYASVGEPTSEIAKRCYLATLGRHHAWPIQQMVSVLLSTLPEKREVIQMMNLKDEELAKTLLLQVSDCGQVVYERVERMVVRLELNDK